MNNDHNLVEEKAIKSIVRMTGVKFYNFDPLVFINTVDEYFKNQTTPTKTITEAMKDLHQTLKNNYEDRFYREVEQIN